MATASFQASKSISQRIAYAIAALLGWQITVDGPIPPKCVIVGAHHTTGWDLIITLLLRLATGLPFRYVFKASFNAGIPGWILRGFGGVPVDNRNSQGFVTQIVRAFDEHNPFMIAILPEGTRGEVTFWRTGFYYIALEATVPIVLGYGDYRRKVVGLGPVITPTGDIEADFEFFRNYYSGVTAKYPEKQGQVRLKPGE